MSAEPEALLSDDDYRSLARFRYALRKFLAFSEDAARDHGLTSSQHQLLLAVRGGSETGDPSISTVAHLLQLRLHSTGELVDRAVDNGLVERRTDPDDRRRVLLTLTTDGRRKLEELSQLHRRELTRFRSQMHTLLEGI